MPSCRDFGGKTVWMRPMPQNLDDAKNIENLDPAAQTHKVMQNIRQLITEAGGEMSHLVKSRIYYRYPLPRDGIPDYGSTISKGSPSMYRACCSGTRAQNGLSKLMPLP